MAMQQNEVQQQVWDVTLIVRPALDATAAPPDAYEVCRQYECAGQLGFNVTVARLLREQHAIDVARFLSGTECIPFKEPAKPTQTAVRLPRQFGVGGQTTDWAVEAQRRYVAGMEASLADIVGR